jgi:hypothetical protein
MIRGKKTGNRETAHRSVISVAGVNEKKQPKVSQNVSL